MDQQNKVYQAEGVVAQLLNVVMILQMHHTDLLQELNNIVEAGKPVSERLYEICIAANFMLHLSWLYGKVWGQWWWLSATSA